MKKLFVICLLIATATWAFAQQREDDIMIVNMYQGNDVDLKCDILPRGLDQYYERKDIVEKIQKMMDSGRYVKSVCHTKYGIVVVHHKNTESVAQKIDCMANFGFNWKKMVNSYFKKGFPLKYYQYDNGFAIFEKNPRITKQSIVKLGVLSSDEKITKKVQNMNAKGLYLIACDIDCAVAQNGHEGAPILQLYKNFSGNDYLLYLVDQLKQQGWVIGSISKNYHQSTSAYAKSSTTYRILFDKAGNAGTNEVAGLVKSPEQLKEFLAANMRNGLSIDLAWGGWDGKTDSSSGWDILAGLVSSVSGLANGGKAVDTSASTANTSSSSASSSKGSTKKSAGSASGKCSRCKGSGKCSPTAYGDRKSACHGSKLCGYCDGTGWIKAGAGEATCKACNGTKKCKTCHGTGKCPQCNGTGK